MLLFIGWLICVVGGFDWREGLVRACVVKGSRERCVLAKGSWFGMLSVWGKSTCEKLVSEHGHFSGGTYHRQVYAQ